MAFDPHANFGYSTVATAPSPASSGTTLSVASGEGTNFSSGGFNCVVWPVGQRPLASNAEIIRVTTRSTDSFNPIVRAQEGSSARTIVVGDQICQCISAKTLTDVESGDFSGAAGPFKVRVAAGTTPTADGALEYDSTQDAFAAGGNGAISGYLPRVLSVQLPASDTLAAATIGTTETAFATGFQLPANFLFTDKTVFVLATFATATQATIPTSLLKMRVQKSGPTNVNLFAHSANALGAGSRVWSILFTITGTAAAGSSVNVMTGSLGAIPNGAVAASSNTVAQPVAISTNAAQTIQFTWTFGSNQTGNTAQLLELIVMEGY